MGPEGPRFLARIVVAKPFELPDCVDAFFRNHGFPEWANLAKIMDEREEVFKDRQRKAAYPSGRPGP